MRIPLALALAAGLAACSRPQPSPEYEKARQLHAALVARSPLDPYAQPQMAQVLELLAQVAPDSLDAEAAKALREKVEGELKAQAEERTRRARLVEGAGRPAAPTPEPAAAPLEAAAAPLAEAAAPEARPPSSLTAGTSLAEFQKTKGECFEAKAPARIAGEGGKSIEGQAWGLKESEACKKAHPDEVGRMVLFADGKLLDVRQASEAKEKGVTRRIEGELRPDGTIGLPRGVELPPGAKVQWDQPPPAKPPTGAALPAPAPQR